MVRCQIAQSLKACLSVQTVNMCSKYLDVISRRSESLIPVMIIETSLARRSSVVFQDDDSSTCAACGGGGKHTHPGTRWWLVRTIQSWLPLYAGGFTYTAGLGSARPRDTNGLNDELNVGEWICAHILIHLESSWVRKKDGKLKNRQFWGVVEKSHILICQKSTAAVTLLLTTWKEQQHHQTAATPSHVLRSLLSGLRYTPFPPTSRTDENPAGSPVGGLVLAETQSLLHVG